MLQDTLEPNELAANERRKAALMEFIASGDAILMAGAGCSGSLYPPWRDFVEALNQAAVAENPAFSEDRNDFLSFADKVKDCLGAERYNTLIYNTFKPGDKTHEHFHEILCRLPFKGITTTNYDTVLESALNIVSPGANLSLHFEGARTKIHEFLMSLNHNKTQTKKVAHLHGICGEPESIVLGGREYSAKYGFAINQQSGSFYDRVRADMSEEELNQALTDYGYEWPIRRKLLWSLLATRRIAFFGFSMTDPYFIKMLNDVKDDLSTYYSESHFLVLRITPSGQKRTLDFARRLKDDFGIQTVFFHDEDNDYSGLGKFIAELDVINPAKQLKNRVIDQQLPATTNVPAGIRKRLLDIGKKQSSDDN